VGKQLVSRDSADGWVKTFDVSRDRFNEIELALVDQRQDCGRREYFSRGTDPE
jgi:hypothetical protein